MSPKTKEQFEHIREQKRNLIINSAVALFAEYGFHATTISMIAKKANISKGLLYNYFESKEDLLTQIMEEMENKVMNLMNPDHDDEITTQEMQNFFSLGLNLLKNSMNYWKLYFQIRVQNDIPSFNSHLLNNEQYKKNKKLIYKYFSERFDDPETELMLFFSLLRGFSIDYVFSDFYSAKELDKFKSRMIELFIKEKKNVKK